MSRWRASGIHLLLSIAIVGTVVLCMLLLWYPWPLFEAAGGSQLIFILASVDVTIGPLITLVIFKAGKKSLKFDLTVIAVLQLVALGYGVQTVYRARPVYLVFAVDRIEVVTAKDLDPKDLAEAKLPQFKSTPLGRPRYIAAEPPTDLHQRDELLSSSLAGKDLQFFPQYYVEFSKLAAKALEKARPVAVLRERDAKTVDEFLADHRLTLDGLKYLPLHAFKRDAAVVLDAKSGEPIGTLLIDPW